MICFEGLFGIKATVLAHSISPQGIEFITYEIEYPRMVLAELNTHGMLVRNSASSRAIPFWKMVEQLIARPVRFGANNPGMQDKGGDFDNLVRDADNCLDRSGLGTGQCNLHAPGLRLSTRLAITSKW